MKNSLKALVVVALLAIAGMANAQNSASATATANATIVCPVSITNNSNLEFGTITNSATGGSVVVPTVGSATYNTVVATTGAHAGPTPHSADFTVKGQGAFAYNVASIVLTQMTGAGGATFGSLTCNVPNNTAGGTNLANEVFPCDNDHDAVNAQDPDNYEGTGPNSDDAACGCTTDDLKVGGTLTLTSAANGPYSGVLKVTIAYN